ncbi:MAG: co-chaperone GroES [Acidimicrobiia bacterium]|nr:co-chaperone GroES [Acidimicrobiia bacterium]MDH4306957.1 co-chaperone GroES [Acidimicrobiia bacterium]MDH5292273.1 co-chaperone GroES [Acidimicrobiia bacterium]
MKLQPLGDRVVVKPDEDQDMRTPSGLVIPDTAKEKPQMGTVIAVGPGALDDDGDRMPMDVNEGDKVLYSKFAGTEVKLEGNEYLVLSARDLLATIG